MEMQIFNPVNPSEEFGGFSKPNLAESHRIHSFQFHELNSHLNSKESETHNLGNNLGPFDSLPAKILEKSGCKCYIQNTSSSSRDQFTDSKEEQEEISGGGYEKRLKDEQAEDRNNWGQDN